MSASLMARVGVLVSCKRPDEDDNDEDWIKERIFEGME